MFAPADSGEMTDAWSCRTDQTPSFREARR